MKDLKKLLWKSLAKNKIATVSRWAFLNASLSLYLKKNFDIQEEITGKIENDIYIIKSANSSFSNLLFLNKKKLLIYLNDKLDKMNFWKIKDIKII